MDLATINCKKLGQKDYQTVWDDMQLFTKERTIDTPDEIWLLEHPPVFTQGLAGKEEHLLFPGDIPVIHVDRGGQVTYHGPGQLIAYILINIKRRQMNIRQLVSGIENAVIDVLQCYGVQAKTRADAPGVYVNGAKIASLGLRIRRGCSYHGLSFNIAMDITPFKRINPCGMKNLPIVQLQNFVPAISIGKILPQVEQALLSQISRFPIKPMKKSKQTC